MLFHQTAQPAVRRRIFKGIVGVLECFDQHGQQFGVFPLLRREFIPAPVEILQFGDEALKFTSTDVVLAWYDYLFKGVQNEFATVPVRIFVMGENKYHQESDWPLPENKLTRYSLP